MEGTDETFGIEGNCQYHVTVNSGNESYYSSYPILPLDIYSTAE